MQHIKLGIVGSSSGNGHPYSWSAILNGYNKPLMEKCPFPGIPEYLKREEITPGNLGAIVTHVWADDPIQAAEIAACSNISIICSELDELVESVDAVLHARDDFLMHPKFLEIYLKAKKPCFIDKPICLDTNVADRFFSLDPFNRYIFTCSALLFSREFQIIESSNVNKISATGPKDWDKYAIHLIEPSLNLLKNPKLMNFTRGTDNEISRSVQFCFEDGKSLDVLTTGDLHTPFSFLIDDRLVVVEDFYFMFKKSLEKFLEFVTTGINPISRAHTMQVISLLERGLD